MQHSYSRTTTFVVADKTNCGGGSGHATGTSFHILRDQISRLGQYRPGDLDHTHRLPRCPSAKCQGSHRMHFKCMLSNGLWLDLLCDVPLPPSGAPGRCSDKGSPGIPRGGVRRGQGAASACGRAHHVGLCPASFHGQPDLQVRFTPPPASV